MAIRSLYFATSSVQRKSLRSLFPQSKNTICYNDANLLNTKRVTHQL